MKNSKRSMVKKLDQPQLKATVVMTLETFDIENIPPEGVILEIPHEQLLPDKNQPRKTFHPGRLNELAESIQDQGLQQYPIVNFWKIVDGKLIFVIKAGERRWRAHGILKRTHITCVVIPGLYDETYSVDRELAQVSENGSREEHTIAEIVQTVRRVVESVRAQKEADGATNRGVVEIALRMIEKAFGKNHGWAASYYQLSFLTDDLLMMLNHGENGEQPLLAWGDAISLVVAPKEKQKILFDDAMRQFPTKPALRRTYIARVARAYRQANGDKVKGRKFEDKDRLFKYIKQLTGLAERLAEGRTSGQHLAHVTEMLSAMKQTDVDGLLGSLKLGLAGFNSLLKLVEDRRNELYRPLQFKKSAR